MKWTNALAKLFYCIIVSLILVLIKVKLGLHDHFFLGLIIMWIIMVVTRLATKGADKLGK
jgi:hypothetical protein